MKFELFKYLRVDDFPYYGCWFLPFKFLVCFYPNAIKGNNAHHTIILFPAVLNKHSFTENASKNFWNESVKHKIKNLKVEQKAHFLCFFFFLDLINYSLMNHSARRFLLPRHAFTIFNIIGYAPFSISKSDLCFLFGGEVKSDVN